MADKWRPYAKHMGAIAYCIGLVFANLSHGKLSEKVLEWGASVQQVLANMKKLFKFFDKLEDRARMRLSHFPIVYAIIGGVAIVLFWRGVWETADMLEDTGLAIFKFLFFAPISGVWSSVLMLLTGLFVSFFIGDRIILTGLKREKKLEEKTEAEVRQESEMISKIFSRLDSIEKKLGISPEEAVRLLQATKTSSEDSNKSQAGEQK